jgi:hypothetical protein
METIYKPATLSYVLDYSDHIPSQEEVTRQIAKVIANDVDGKIRNTLIGLGWTPPNEEMTMIDATDSFALRAALAKIEDGE